MNAASTIIEAFIDELDLKALGFDGVVPEVTGRPSYHPATLLKIYLYGYLNRIPSSRRLERETQRMNQVCIDFGGKRMNHYTINPLLYDEDEVYPAEL